MVTVQAKNNGKAKTTFLILVEQLCLSRLTWAQDLIKMWQMSHWNQQSLSLKTSRLSGEFKISSKVTNYSQ